MDELAVAFRDSYEFRMTGIRREGVLFARRAEVLVLDAPYKDIISSATNCEWIHVLGAGVDEYLSMDLVRNNEKLLLTNSSGAYGIQVAEHVFAMILGLTRGLRRIIPNQERRIWLPSSARPAYEDPGEIYGRTMGIVGLGNVGLEIAKRAKGFGLRVIGTKRRMEEALPLEYDSYVDEVTQISRLPEVVSKSDIIVDALPLTAQTRNVFDWEVFSQFREGSIFINVGRGKTVAERDLINALKSGRIAYSGLDVFDEEPLSKSSELWSMENVIVSPHNAGRSTVSFQRAWALLKENLGRYSRGERLMNIVDRSVGY